VSAPFFDGTFPHLWQAEILPKRPLILPTRHFVYPAQAEEVESGALEVLIRPEETTQEFLATCALGFRDPAVPTGIWTPPNPDEICAVCGGYAYVIDTHKPERFTMIPYRPVIEIRPVLTQNLLLFVGHHSILAWGANGQAWKSDRLTSEGLTIAAFEGSVLHGLGWEMMTDKEIAFTLDLRTGLRLNTHH
jgi:hypothetical protein